MKGLLIKEIGIIKAQKAFFFIIAALVIFGVFISNDIAFAFGYISFTIPVFVCTTISYDEFDNGYAFLFTLPIGRRLYVLEKYILGLILSTSFFVVIIALSLVKGAVDGTAFDITTIHGLPLIVAISAFVLSVMVPVQIKFGAEKSRVALIAVSGAVVALCFLIPKILDAAKIDVSPIFDFIDRIDLWLWHIGSIVLAAVILLISIKLSTQIINKKEF